MIRFLLTIIILLCTTSLQAAETRGLSVVAKDSTTNQTGEVKLYNKSYAVIIGIDRYRNLSPDRQLKNAVNDAQGVEETIQKHFRFNKIFSLHNEQATRDGIMRLLTSELPRTITKEDALFVFWAGHGNQEKTDYGDVGYLIPYDGNADGIYGNITMSQLKNDISRAIPAKHVFYAFDACYSGLMTSRSVDKKVSRNLAYLKDITKENVRQVLTAGLKGQEALDGGPRGHSVFTGRLIEALEATGDYITANEIQAIIKEKVYQDAQARGHEQTPGYGTLYGSGDFVFVPNIEQKVQDNKAELARMEAELKRYEAQEANSRRYQSEKQQRQAEQERKAAEARLKAEQLRQQHLVEEEKRQQEMLAERSRFDADQKQREQQMTVEQKGEQQRMAILKAELAKKKLAAPVASTGSLAAAIAEIKRLNGDIEGIEATFSRELSAGKNRISARYDSEIAAIRLASKQKQTPLVRDEFETEVEFKAKVAKLQSSYSDRIAQLEQKQRAEITDLERRLALEQQNLTADLRQSMKQIGDKEFTVGAESLKLELGQYNPDKLSFPISISNSTQLVKVAMNGTIPLPRDAARTFKQEYSSGLVRPQLTVKAGGNLLRVALVNDSDNSVYEHQDGEFITASGRKLREEWEKERQSAGEMVGVPGGCFTAEGKQTCLDAFRIGKYEVTQGQYKRIMGSNPSGFNGCGDDCPVEAVSWDDTQLFISKLNGQTGKHYRLPSEAEWQYACTSGGNNEEYCGSNNIDAVAWYSGNSGSKTHPVGQKQPNGLDIHDMSGNVWEWVQDWYGSNYPNSGNNPTGASSGSSRVIRGGSWSYEVEHARAANRYNFSPRSRISFLGFRLVSPVQ
ncbi:MAG: SUMF1/EgtB/PvdO family nonheme iron enzyme [Chlorobium sp.]|nr:SUMF1/EgtB/PvdO family nonheme iron enzyme [Chlorobium sp.]